jgi:hypothetical protein
MALTGQTPGIPDYTYRGLLNLNNDALGLTASLRNVKDGLGNNSGIRLSTAEFEYSGIFTFASKTASTLIYLNASKQVTSLANAAGVLTNDGAGNFSYSAGSSGIVINTTPITSGTDTYLLFQASGKVSQSANLFYDGSKLSVAGNIEGTGGTLYISAIYGGNVGTPSPVVIRASASPIMRLETTGVYVGSNSSAGSNLAVETIVGVKALTVGGKDKEFYLDSGNAIATGETDLYVRTFEASVFGSNGDTAYFAFTATILGAATITKRLKLYFGGTNVYDSTAQVFATNDVVRLSGEIIRVSSSVVRVVVVADLNTGVAITLTNYVNVTGLTLSNTQIFKLTGESAGVGSNNNDIVAKMGYIRVEELSQ